MQIGHATIFVRPLQRNLNLDHEVQQGGSNELGGHLQKCLTCGEEFPFTRIKAHSDECVSGSQSINDVGVTTTESASRSEGRLFGMLTRLQRSETTRASNTTPQGHVAAPEIVDLVPTEERGFPDWKILSNPSDAAKTFKENILSQHATGKSLYLAMDLRDSAEDRERALLSFYKMANVEWACPLTCTLKGDPAIGDGVTRHFFATNMSKRQHGFEMNFGT
ncbi:uncharacterized protein LOC120812556 [Gasterosteus aculeatus]